MTYSIIIPIYNEEDILPELHRRLTSVLDSLGESSEVILIDDGSADHSYDAMNEIHRKDQRFKVLRLSRNFGHQVAITAGLDYATGEAVILMDGDLQDPPELLAEMTAQWKAGYQVVYTVKRSRKENALKRFAFASFYRLMHTFSSISIPMEAGNFSLLDKRVVDVLRNMPERNRYISGMRAWAGFTQVGVEFHRDARYSGMPKMTLKRLINLALDGLISFSNAPLRLAIYIGVVVAGFSFLGAAYVIYEKLFTHQAILGWTSTIVAITFIGGMILLTLGVIGEYIGRIYDEVKHRPIYIVKDKIGL
ncbi:MAG: glycosyltransferase family 2 protein [Ignavibacteria bacterium]|nr:glycosyltransferase family 2 protein [Ignavibacteria bacterium]MBI3766173.1 glycosyltransferase family 2 protein [Ignavibacteriales bacterium]